MAWAIVNVTLPIKQPRRGEQNQDKKQLEMELTAVSLEETTESDG